ncbi:MAG: MFS transporter [Betaproteobacteria bacterium]
MHTAFFVRHPEYVVILAGVSAALHIGKLPPAIPVLRETLGVSLVQAGFLLSVVQMAGMLLGLLVGLAADGIGLRRAMLAGLMLLSIAGALGALAQDPGSLLLLRALEGCGFLLAVMPAPGLIRRLTPPKMMSSAMGLWGAYMPFGTALALAGGPLLIGWANWRLWWLLIALLTVVMAIWVYLAIAPDGDGSTGPAAARVDAMHPTVWVRRVRRTLGSYGPWLVAACFALYSGQWLAVIGFLPSIAGQSGAVGAGVAPLLALVALVNVVGNVASGRLLQRGVPAKYLLAAGFCAMALGAIVAFSDSGLGLGADRLLLLRYLGVVLFSMVGGMIPGTLFSLAVLLAPDEGSISTTVGWVQQLSSLGQFIGPPAVAWVAAQAGGWQWTWVITGSCCLLGLVVAQRIGQEVKRAR